MVSKSLAFGLLVGSCVAAAGAGAYFATLQHHRSTTGTAASLGIPASAPAPQPVGSGDPPPATTVGSAPATQGVETTAAPNPAGDGTPAAQVSSASRKPLPQAPASRGERNDIPAPPPRSADAPSSNSNQGTVPIAATAAPPQSADPGGSAQRPWPGPPPVPASPASGGVSGRADGESPAQDNVKLWEELVVPTESVLGLQLESSLNTEQAQVEDRVDARVTRDVRVNGRVAIPSGSHVVGSVVLVERGGRMKERARIGIRFNTLVLADSTRLQIGTETLYRESESPANKTSAKIGGAAIGGAIIGAIIGGGKGAAIGSGIGAAGGTAAAMTSERMVVSLPAGTTVSVRTQAPITVTVEK
jgi:hypothetical protein